MSTIADIKIRNYLNWKIFEIGTEFIFFILYCSFLMSVNMNIRILLCLPFTRHIWKTVFFFVLSKNRHGAYLLNILKQATENSVQKEMKKISPIFISLLIFGFPQNSYFHIIFTISVLAQIRRIIYWGKRMKGIQMNQFLYLSIQDCQTWMGICLEKLNVRTLIRICIICRINIVNQ